MLNEYGASGSATYAVEMSGIDPMMAVLPDNNFNQITARNVRDIVYTLWENGGGGGGEFFYTQTAPLNEKSTSGVGGISSGRTFSQVPLQQLFDEMFFPPLANEYSISGGTDNLFGTPNVTANIVVSFKQKNDKSFSQPYVTVTSARGAAWSGHNIQLSPPPDVPPGKNTSGGRTYNNQAADANQVTTWTLNVKEGGVSLSPKTTQVTWYLNRYYGVVNFAQFDSDFDLTSARAKTQIGYTTIAQLLPFVGFNRISLTGTKQKNPLSSVTFTNPNGYHVWMAWPSTDFGDGIPNKFIFNNNEVTVFTKLAVGDFVNEQNYSTSYTLWVSNKKQSSITISIE